MTPHQWLEVAQSPYVAGTVFLAATWFGPPAWNALRLGRTKARLAVVDMYLSGAVRRPDLSTVAGLILGSLNSCLFGLVLMLSGAFLYLASDSWMMLPGWHAAFHGLGAAFFGNGLGRANQARSPIGFYANLLTNPDLAEKALQEEKTRLLA